MQTWFWDSWAKGFSVNLIVKINFLTKNKKAQLTNEVGTSIKQSWTDSGAVTPK